MATHSKTLIETLLIQHLRTRSLRGISQNNQVTLHVILLKVGGTIYNQYTITPLLNLGVSTHKVHQLATALHCHAMISLNKITKTRPKYNSKTTVVRGSNGGVTGRTAGFRRARRRPDRIADNPPDPH
jgi:hypothetical protein